MILGGLLKFSQGPAIPFNETKNPLKYLYISYMVSLPLSLLRPYNFRILFYSLHVVASFIQFVLFHLIINLIMSGEKHKSQSCFCTIFYDFLCLLPF
jgi:hypothetical protein